jgi:hypothetical protein
VWVVAGGDKELLEVDDDHWLGNWGAGEYHK